MSHEQTNPFLIIIPSHAQIYISFLIIFLILRGHLQLEPLSILETLAVQAWDLPPKAEGFSLSVFFIFNINFRLFCRYY